MRPDLPPKSRGFQQRTVMRHRGPAPARVTDQVAEVQLTIGQGAFLQLKQRRRARAGRAAGPDAGDGRRAAAWCGHDGAVQAVFEDVGRHNGLDKLVGHLALRGSRTCWLISSLGEWYPRPANCQARMLFQSSAASSPSNSGCAEPPYNCMVSSNSVS